MGGVNVCPCICLFSIEARFSKMILCRFSLGKYFEWIGSTVPINGLLKRLTYLTNTYVAHPGAMSILSDGRHVAYWLTLVLDLERELAAQVAESAAVYGWMLPAP
jgi:hypothetical protein